MLNDEIPRDVPPAPRRKGGLLYVSGVIVVVAIALLAFFLARSHRDAAATERTERLQKSAAGVKVEVAKVTTAPAVRTITLPGDVRAYRTATLYSKVSGYLKEIRVDRGDEVKANDVLGVVAAPETEQQLTSLESELKKKEAIAARLRTLVPSGVSSQQDLDRAEADVQTTRAEVDPLRTVKGFDVIRAPFDGTITARYADVGALMPAAVGSTQAAQPLVELADMNRVRVTIYPGQLDAPLIQPGAPVSVVLDSDPAHPITATVTRVSHALDPRTRTMPAEVELENHDRRLIPGLYVHVTTTVAGVAGVVIPADTVFIRAGVPTVARVESGHVHFVAIQVADDDGKVVRVSGGLAVGDAVILHVSDEISDGGPVQIVEPAPRAPAAPTATTPASQPASTPPGKP